MRFSSRPVRWIVSPMVAAAICWATAAHGSAQDDPFADKSQPAVEQPKPAPDTRFQKLEEMLNRVRFKGHFTIVANGKTETRQEEEYIIRSAKKLADGDKWQLNATIRYGKVNATLPLVLDIKWADKTPVITLDSLAIPGLGTFSARVLIHEGRYAGTWQHDEVGGHLYGVIEKLPAEESTPSADRAQTGRSDQ